MRLRAGSSTTPAALTGSVDYDDTQSQSLPRDFSSAGSRTPQLVRKGKLSIVVTPSTLYVRSDRARFRIYVVNGGDGTAYNTLLKDVIPTGLTPNQAETDALNLGVPVSVAGQQMQWNLGDLAPGVSDTIEVVANVGGTTCSIPAGANAITATWGCGGVDQEVIVSNLPNLLFPTGSMQILHDTSNTQAGVCDPTGGKDVIIVRNTGATHIYNIVVNEVLNPLTTGIDIAGTVEYSINGGGSWAPIAGATGGAGTTLSPYTWNSTNVGNLGDLSTQSEGGVYEVRIRFPVSGNELTNGTPSITADGSGVIGCGAAVSSPGTGYSLTVRRPNMTVATTGRNVTTGGSLGETVYGKPGETVQWQAILNNAGAYQAKNILFKDNLPNSTPAAPADLAGPGILTTIPLTDNVEQSIADVAATSSSTYTVTEVLGPTCVDENSVASIRWGCSGTATITTPTNNSDGAAIVMNPNFTATQLNQVWTARPGGNGEIAVTITNTGAVASTLKITETLVNGFKYDNTYVPVLSGTGSGVGNITGYTVNETDLAVPVFTLTGELNQGKALTLTFRVYQDSNFDTTQSPFTHPETVGNGFDPSLPAAANNTTLIEYQNGCSNNNSASRSQSLDPLTPDLDISMTNSTLVAAPNTAYTFDFTIVNNGDAGSTANNITFTPDIGGGWTSKTVTLITPGAGGTASADCAAGCTAAQMGTLAQGASAVVRVVATATANSLPLRMKATVTGGLGKNDGTLTGNNYSLDSAQARVVGYAQSLTLQATSETFTTGSNLAIGEEATFRLHAEFFGSDSGDASSAFTAITLRDTLPTGFGYVSHTNTGSHTAGYAISGNTAGSPGAINFAVSDVTTEVGVVFEVDLVARLLNVGGNTNNAAVVDPFGARYTVFGQVFASNNSADSFSGAQASLHSQVSTTVKLPSFTFDKKVRNLSGGAFADSAAGDADDDLEYRIIITNTGTAPAFDLSVTDTLSAKLNLIDGAVDGIDNDGDGSTSGPEGTFTVGLGGNVLFNQANTSLLTAGHTFGQLDPTNAITLLYRAKVGTNAIPNEILANNAQISANTLPGPTGSQTGATGATGTSTGEATLSTSDVANVQVQLINFTKSIDSTSVGGDTSANVLVGEQIRYTLALELPEGVTPALIVHDSLPQGLSLVNRLAVGYGSSVSGCTSPTILPASLPASGNPQALSWDFGTCTVAAGTSAQRSVTIQYDVQVRNISGNLDGTTLANTAYYTFTGYTSPNSGVTATVKAPNINVFTVAVAPATGIDAGDEITYTVSMTNNGTATAYDLNITDVLPTGTTYASTQTLTAPDVSGQNITWGRAQAVPQVINLAAGATLTYTYKATLNDSVEADQVLTNSVSMTYTSLPLSPGPNLTSGVVVGAAAATNGERDGSGVAPNTYSQTGNASATVKKDFTVIKTKSNDTLTPEGFRIGDTITYTLAVTVQEGTVDAFQIRDTLPTGLEFVGFDAITPAPGGVFTYTAPTGGNAPTAGATGALVWNIGTLVSSGDNNATNQTLTLIYRAKVKDAGGVTTTPTSQNLVNNARLTYLNFADVAQTSAASTVTAKVMQPQLTIVKALRGGQPTSVTQGSTVAYRITVSNGGDAPAYNIVLEDTLPGEMRTATPTVGTTTLNGVTTSLGTPTYNPLTGLLVWTLSDANALNAGQSLVIDFDATVNSNAGGGLTLANSAVVSSYYSLESLGSPADRRHYGPSATSVVNVTTPAPTDMGKTLDKTTPNVGETVTYTLRIPETAVNVVLYDVAISDVVPADLQVVSVVDNGVGAGFSYTPAGNNVAVGFTSIPANSRAVVTITAVVRNASANQSSHTISNQGSFTWSKVAAGPAQSAISSPTLVMTVKEPTLTVDETFISEVLAFPGQGLQTGDTIHYRISVTNTGDGPAHDFVIRAVNHAALISPVITPFPDNPGAAINAGTSSGFTTWTWTVPGPLAPAATYVFDVTYTLDAVQPYQNLLSTADVTWTSTLGVNINERNGSDGIGGLLNDYAAIDATPVTRTTGPITFTKIEKAPAPGLYAIGQDVVYQLTMNFISGQVKRVHFIDALPTGLNFRSASVSASNAVKLVGGGSIAVISGPAQGDTGTLTFDLGDVVSTGTSPSITLELTARVRDGVGNVAGTTLTNVSSVKVENPNDPGNPLSDVTVAATANPVITVIAPNLYLALDGAATIDLGYSTDLTARITNVGNSPGFQPVIQLQLPSGMRNTDPSSIKPIVAAITGGRTLAFTPTYVVGTGILTLTFTSAASYVANGEQLDLTIPVILDNDQTSGNNYLPLATVTRYYSRDQSAGATAENHTTTNVLGSGTMGTANGDVPVHVSDDVSITSRTPTLRLTKAVSHNSAAPGTAPGTELTYTLTITNLGTSPALVTNLTDNLPTQIQPGTLVAGNVAPSSGTLDTSNTTGGTNFTGLVTLTNATVAGGGGTVTFNFKATLKDTLPNGSYVSNQAQMAVSGITDPFLSDSTFAGDNDGVETGNNASDANDDDPTRTLIASAPILSVSKISADVNGAPLAPSDVLRYTITFANTGNENVNTAKLTDSIPSSTTYVAGSTKLNNVTVADVLGTSALVGGLTVNGVGDPAGELRKGSTGTVTFDVTVNAGVPNATTINNQAFLTSRRASNVDMPTVPSDDPRTSIAGDPTVDVVGTGPVLRAQKTVVDVNGAPLGAGEELQYTIVVRNVGATAATNLIFTDAIPPLTTYVSGTLEYDTDGPAGGSGFVTVTDAGDGDAGDFNSTAASAITIRRTSLAPGAEIGIRFKVQVNPSPVPPPGTVITNQGVINADGLPTVYTDVDGNPTNGTQPTQIVVGSGGALHLSKAVSDINGGVLLPGDTLLYTMVMRNVGTIAATNITITDPAPTLTTYVLGTTTWNGSLVADNAPNSQLVAGLNIGTLNPGESATITFRNSVPPGAATGTRISNQASYTASAATLTGISDSDLDDALESGNNGSDPHDDDPTVIEVGSSQGIAAVRGNVWLDENFDNLFTAGEVGQRGWRVEILLRGQVVGEGTTNAAGEYYINGLVPGPGYSLRFRHPETGIVYGHVKSSEPGTTTGNGMIEGLNLPSGLTIIEQNLPLDPNGKIYNSITRAPVTGAVVDMQGPPGFDPTTMLMPGQHNQTTGSDGFYRFDILPGAPVSTPSAPYRIVVTNPAGYLPGASTVIPPQTGPLVTLGNMPSPYPVVSFSSVPTGAQPTTYYYTFDIQIGNPMQPEIVNNHIPIDPILKGAIVATKRTPLLNVHRGELVPYTLTFKNQFSATLPNIDLVDTLPPGFKYLEGSARLNGNTLEPTKAGRVLNWPNLTFTANEEKTIKIVTIIGSGVGQGEYTNQTVAVNNVVNSEVSNTATAAVRVTPDELFDCPELIGKVFDDKNRNGVQDPNEPGLPGVRIASARGWLVTTDMFGRYHLTCPIIPRETIGSNFILKVDERTLPTGYRVTTENPRVVRLTAGKMSKANFGVSIHRVVRIEVKDEAFDRDLVDLKKVWVDKLSAVINALDDPRSVVRLAYYTSRENTALVHDRLTIIKTRLQKLWKDRDRKNPLIIEEEISWAKEGVYE